MTRIVGVGTIRAMSNAPNPEQMEHLAKVVGAMELMFGRKQLAVWRIEQGRVSAVYGLVAAEGGAVPRLCKRHAAELAAGQVVRTAGSTLLPLVHDGLLGVVHVTGEPKNPPNLLLPIVRVAIATLSKILAQPDELPSELDVLTVSPVPAARESRAASIDAELDAAQRQVQDAERKQLVYKLGCNDWNVSKTARQLGLSRGFIWSRMRALDVRRPTPAPTDPRGARSASTDGAEDFPGAGLLQRA